MHIFLIFGRLYHINSETDMHIFSIFGRLYHINSETDMHIFSIFGRMYHTNSETDMHIFSFLAVCITLIANLLCTLLHLAGYFLICFLTLRKDYLTLRAIYRIVKQRIISDHRRVSIGCRTLLEGGGWRWKQMH